MSRTTREYEGEESETREEEPTGEEEEEEFQDAVETSTNSSPPVPTGYATISITDTAAILPYPGVPSKCCLCEFVSNAKDQAAMAVSILRHLHNKHGKKLNREWKCSTCFVVLPGYEMRKHKCITTLPTTRNNQAQSPLPATTRLRRLSISVTPSVSIQPSSPRVLGASHLNTSVNSSVRRSSPRQPPGVAVSDPMSELHNRPPVGQTSPGQSDRISFSMRWMEAFRSCTSREQLETTLDSCSTDWIAVAGAAAVVRGERGEPRRPDVRRKRTQTRQQQRIRKQRKSDPRAASRIQKLFNLYPRRAVREVLGEDSPPYSGELADATASLEATYHRPVPSEEEVAEARATFDSCEWAVPSEEDTLLLAGPPRKEEVLRKLLNATNTSPGNDRIEYRHIKMLDPNCCLLETIYDVVWTLGIPRQWKEAKTILVHKKGDTTVMSNFRPISLLSTIYKLFSGVLTSRLTRVAMSSSWLSAEQKGFLPGVRGIQEHTQLLWTIIDGAKRNKTDISITWLDLTNAFGSLPHAVLRELFDSLPVPVVLRNILNDIYADNISNFLVAGSSIPIRPTAGVRQGDALSSIVFNLAAEALVRAAKSSINSGVDVHGVCARVTAYADDMTIIGGSWKDQQRVLDVVNGVAQTLGLQFNGAKCSNFSMRKGLTCNSELILNDLQLRCLGEEEHECYLGEPIGARLRFRPATSIPRNLHLLADSLLAPWQKLEVFRAYLIPSMSHHLASGRVEKRFLAELEQKCRNFLRLITNQPNSSSDEFFYADRRVGGLGVTPLPEDADIWTLARATQLLDSDDPTIRQICRQQLAETVAEKLKKQPNDHLPISEFLSGSMSNGLYEARYGGGRENLWTRARKAAIFRKVKIDVSSDESPSILVADDISVTSIKAVRGLRTACRQAHTAALLATKFQGRAANGLALDTSSNDIARLTSCRTSLNFKDWHYIFRGRLGLLPLRGCPGSQAQDQNCRRCKSFKETTQHVTSGCRNNFLLARERHNAVQKVLEDALRRQGHTLTIDCCFPGSELRPDIVVTSVNPPALIDISVAYDYPDALHSALNEKASKYRHLGPIYPFIVGAFGSWLPENRDIQLAFGLTARTWNSMRRKARLAAIQGTTRIISSHLAGSRDAEMEPDDIDLQDILVV